MNRQKRVVLALLLSMGLLIGIGRWTGVWRSPPAPSPVAVPPAAPGPGQAAVGPPGLVEEPPAPLLTVSRPEVAPGDTIGLRFAGIRAPTGTDWIGLFPCDAKNTAYTEWHYLQGQPAGTVNFAAPAAETWFEFRLFLNWPAGGYRDVARSKPFRVVRQPQPPLAGTLYLLEKMTFRPGETIRVRARAEPGFAANAWLGIVPAGVPHGSEAINDRHDLVYLYLTQRPAGEYSFTAPAKSGLYDLRLHDTDSNGKEVASVTFLVTTALDDIGGAWRDDAGGSTVIRQVGDRVWWYGQPADPRRSAATVAFGTIDGDKVELQWAELPRRDQSGPVVEMPLWMDKMASGTLVLQILSAREMVALRKPDGCQASRWTR